MDQTAMDFQHTQQGSPLPGLIVIGLIAILMIASLWRLFGKAGEPGWAAIVPIYNVIVLLKIAGKPWWWLFLFVIPLVNIVIQVLVALGVAKNFGKGAGFGIGLWLLGVIFYPILAFGSATYQGGGAALPAKA